MTGAEKGQDEHFFQALFEHAPDGIVVVSPEGTILSANRMAHTITGYPMEAGLKGVPISALVPEQEREAFLKTFQSGEVPGGGNELKSGILKKDGSGGFVSWTFSRMADGPAVPGSRIACFRDISAVQLFENARTSALKFLNKHNSVIRHDIMNQLTILIGYLELSNDFSMDETLKQFKDREEGAAETIKKQVAFTKIYQDIGLNPPAWIDIATMIKEVTVGIDQPGMNVQVSVPEGTMIFMDPLFRKIVFNLIENSVIHGKTKEIRVSSENPPGGLLLVFQDNGQGVPVAEKEKIFTRAYGPNRGYGLYLAREILGLYNMSIKETGEPGKGARFEIIIPDGMWKVG